MVAVPGGLRPVGRWSTPWRRTTRRPVRCRGITAALAAGVQYVAVTTTLPARRPGRSLRGSCAGPVRRRLWGCCRCRSRRRWRWPDLGAVLSTGLARCAVVPSSGLTHRAGRRMPMVHGNLDRVLPTRREIIRCVFSGEGGAGRRCVAYLASPWVRRHRPQPLTTGATGRTRGSATGAAIGADGGGRVIAWSIRSGGSRGIDLVVRGSPGAGRYDPGRPGRPGLHQPAGRFIPVAVPRRLSVPGGLSRWLVRTVAPPPCPASPPPARLRALLAANTPDRPSAGRSAGTGPMMLATRGRLPRGAE
jgi:hypothetical protein